MIITFACLKGRVILGQSMIARGALKSISGCQLFEAFVGSTFSVSFLCHLWSAQHTQNRYPKLFGVCQTSLRRAKLL